MAGKQNSKDAVAMFEQKLLATRKERNEKLAQDMLGHDPKKLAQQMLGKERRASGVKSPGPAASLASRVGINKRSNSLPRLNSPRLNPTNAPPRAPRQPSALNRSVTEDHLSTRAKQRPVKKAAGNSGSGLSIRGAAGGPYILRAQNFAPGTTAADIESVMQTEGQVTYCTLVAAQPTVIAEIGFVEKASADRIIDKFNNKRADGRLLYVYYADSGGALQKGAPSAQVTVDFVVDEVMDVDENAEARNEQDRLREERRGRDGRGPREAFQQQPADERYDDQYYRGDRRQEGQYEDGRYGFAGYRGPPAGRGFGNGGRGGRFDGYGGGYNRRGSSHGGYRS